MSDHFCLLCSLRLDTASKRRLIHPITEVNASIHEFFVHSVAPGYVFSPSHVRRYLCRFPCYTNLEKALKHYTALQSLLEGIRTQLHVGSGQSTVATANMTEVRHTACVS